MGEIFSVRKQVTVTRKKIPALMFYFRLTLIALFLLVYHGTAGAQFQSIEADGGGRMPVNIRCNDQLINREALHTEQVKTIARFRAEGILGNVLLSDPVRFIFPLAQKEGVNDPGFHGISNFVDHNPVIGLLTDYTGGTRTYDLTSGYQHQGTDYFLWPFNWNKVEDDEVVVVAAAAGNILNTIDGNPDISCGFDGAGQWNAVYLVHDDGSRTWYGHMKNGSVTTKVQGARVEAGEVLGVVASSGMSSGPHLHFEVYNSNNQLIDPYAGPSNPTTMVSWWLEQHDYHDSAINRLIVHSAPPQFNACPNVHLINEAVQVEKGDAVSFAAYYRDQLEGQLTQFRVLNPFGEPAIADWSHQSSVAHYAASYWYFNRIIGEEQPSGLYTFEASFGEEIYTQQFQVGAITSVELDAGHPTEFRLLQNFPNPFNPSTSIRFYLPEAGPVRLAVYDLTGREVALLEDDHFSAGNHNSAFNAVNLSSGIYMYRLDAGKFSEVKKMTLVK